MIIFLKTLLLGQYNWMDQDLSSVDRSRTPWIIFIGSVTFHNSSDNKLVMERSGGKKVSILIPNHFHGLT
jgi:hypothetical protein